MPFCDLTGNRPLSASVGLFRQRRPEAACRRRPQVGGHGRAAKNAVQAVGAVQQTDQKNIRSQARRIVLSADRGSAEVETVDRADKIVGEAGWSFGQGLAAFFVPSPLGLAI